MGRSSGSDVPKDAPETKKSVKLSLSGFAFTWVDEILTHVCAHYLKPDAAV